MWSWFREITQAMYMGSRLITRLATLPGRGQVCGCVWSVWCQPIWRRGQGLMQYKDVAVSFWSARPYRGLLMFYSPRCRFTSRFPPFKCHSLQPPYLQSDSAVYLVSVDVVGSCWSSNWHSFICVSSFSKNCTFKKNTYKTILKYLFPVDPRVCFWWPVTALIC